MIFESLITHSIIFWRERPETINQSAGVWKSLEYTPNFPEKKRRKRKKKGEEGNEEEEKKEEADTEKKEGAEKEEEVEKKGEQ